MTAKIDASCLASNLSRLLKSHHLSFAQLAQALDIPVMTVRRLVSGETADPRISTLMLLANYFKISVDALVHEPVEQKLIKSKQIEPYLIPKLTWEALPKLASFQKETVIDWVPVSLPPQTTLSARAFALDSRPSMHPRYPHGTVLMIDPDVKPVDGDVVLIELRESASFTLRELVIDPPECRLVSLIPESSILLFDETKHTILGVCMLTMFYNVRE